MLTAILRFRAVGLLSILVVLSAGALPAATADVRPYREGDESVRAYSILPPGQGRHPNILEFLQISGGGAHPPHFNNQLGMYESLVRGAPTLSDEQLPTYFKDASFGVRPQDVGRSYSLPLRDGLNIVRDAAFGVPRVYGQTRADVMYGAGYVSAEDRLFAMDVFRHLSRGRLSELLGASAANLAMDQAQRSLADYTEEEIAAMGERLREVDPELAETALADLRDYAAGVNAYIVEALIDPRKLPAEYPLLQQVPKLWTVNDSLAQTVLIGAMFSPGGGGQLANDRFLAALEQVTGNPAEARAIFDDFRSAEEPEAPTTTDRYFGLNDHLGPPDPEAVVRADQPGVVAAQAEAEAPEFIDGPLGPIRLGQGIASNALLVDAELSATGNPLAVMGPQVAYWTPQVVMEIEMQGPGISTRGIMFPGMGPSVILGRGPSYAWSLTTAIADHQDIRAVRLCDPSGGAPAADAVHYLDDGECKPMYVRTDVIPAKPSLGGIPSPPTNVVLRETTQRTRHGIVASRGTVGGEPVAFVRQRSSYMREAEILLTYTKAMDPARVPEIEDLMDAFGYFPLAFNIFLVHRDRIGYYTAGLYPVLAQGVDPDLVFWGDSRWDWERLLAFEEHPQEVDPERGYILNWNNKQAPGFRSADNYWAFGSIHRNDLLERQLLAEAADDGKVDLSGLVRAMQIPATQDLRGAMVLPRMLEVIGPVADPRLDDALGILRAWEDKGAQRRDLTGNGRYEEAAAVALMDAWWHRALQRVFGPELGAAYSLVPPIRDNAPGPDGTAYATGWYGHLHKDLRSVLGAPVEAPFSRTYCGAGTAVACRSALLQALDGAVSELETAYGPNPSQWSAQESRDQLRFSSVGVVGQRAMHWQNRPTFNHVLEFGK